MASLFNAVSINQSRYFFATQADGEQQLDLEFGTTGGAVNLSTMAVGITGSQGNSVIVNQAPQFVASEFVLGEDASISGTNGTYFTLSTLATNLTGTSISVNRTPGSGITSIEAYGANGPFGGYEFLSRGLNSALVSTTSVGINNYISSVGRAGATAVLGASGTMLTGSFQGSVHNSIDNETGGGGRVCFGIYDLSGAGGVQSLQRWGLGTADIPAGNDTGSDYYLFRYGDAGNFLGTGYSIRRSDGAFEMPNLSSIATQISSGVYAQVYPASKTNAEFGAEGTVEIVAGATSNQTLFGSVWAPLFSTPLTGLNPNGQTFLSINWANGLSTNSNHVNYKVGFSTSTAYTNVINTSYVPGSGGTWTPSDLPSATSPIGHTLITCCIDPDGVNADGTGTLFVQGQLSDPAAAADQIFIAKGITSEPTRNALVWRPI